MEHQPHMTTSDQPCTGVTVKDVAVPDVVEPPWAARVSAAVRNLFALDNFAVDFTGLERWEKTTRSATHPGSWLLRVQPEPCPYRRRSCRGPLSGRTHQPPPRPPRMPCGFGVYVARSGRTLLWLYAPWERNMKSDSERGTDVGQTFSLLFVSSVHRWE